MLPENELCVSRKPLARDELVMLHRANGTLVLREDDNHHKKQLPQQPPRATHDLSGPFPGVRLSFFDFASTSDSHTTHLPRSAHAHALRWHNSNIKPRGRRPCCPPSHRSTMHGSGPRSTPIAPSSSDGTFHRRCSPPSSQSRPLATCHLRHLHLSHFLRCHLHHPRKPRSMAACFPFSTSAVPSHLIDTRRAA